MDEETMMTKSNELKGKIVLYHEFGKLDESGYPCAIVHFTDGSKLIVEEVSQTGKIKVEVETAA